MSNILEDLGLSEENEEFNKVIDDKDLMSSTHIFKPILGQWQVETNEHNHLIGKINIKAFPVMGWTLLHVVRRLSLGLSSSYSVSGFKFRVNSHGKEIEPNHEYEAITGIVEDVPYIHYNVKGIIFNVEYLTEEKLPIDYIMLNVKGNQPGPLYASYVDLDEYNASQENVKLTVVNPDHLICNLDVNTVIEGKILLRYGFGYASEEDNEKYFNRFLSSSAREGWFFLSTQFSNGVLMVHGNVTEVTSGITPYDLLELKVVTDGRIAPEQVIQKSFEILREQIPYEGKEVLDTTQNLTKNSNITYNNGYNSATPLSQLNFPSNVINILIREDVLTLGDLLNRSENSLKVLKGIGTTKLSSLKIILQGLGLSLKK